MSLIDVVVVESHQHALEHVHSAIRKGKHFEPWSMLHFDAHPDLACPRLPAIACFLPRRPIACSPLAAEEKNLYELLDLSSSGIAEWITPLVLGANLQVIEWIKPNFSMQLPIGFHRYRIGAYDGSTTVSSGEINSFLDLSPAAEVKTDLSLPYYLDDDSVVRSEQLLLAQTLDLHVTELSSAATSVLASRSSGRSWALDICLDYFSCLNPFLIDIDKVDPAATHSFVNLMKEAKYGTEPEKNLRCFRETLEVVLSAATECAIVSGPFEKLSHFYETREKTTELVGNLKRYIGINPSLLPLILKAIPNWNMPHAVFSVDRGHIRESLQLVEKAIQSQNSVPFVVTICRSTDDEFTPASVVEFLQEQVIMLLHRIFCGTERCDRSCRIRIVKDYGQWEGSSL